MNKRIFPILIIFFISLILFSKPLFSNQPLGLDSLGHLSKVSYLREFPTANWDMSWYSGTLFLKMYSPLFYYLVAIFPNDFFAANLLCFLSIFFTSLGIYFIIKYKTDEEKASLIGSICFLTVLGISYYWVATANLPFFVALWTVPFSLYFLERSIKENKKKDFVYYSLIFAAGILTHVIIGFIISVLMIIRLLFDHINKGTIKRIFLYGIFAVLISSFWFIPFLINSNSSETSAGYVPSYRFLFGFGECCWGLQAGGIGILSFLFIPAILLFLLTDLRKNKNIFLYFIGILFLLFLTKGGLGSHYPYGVDPVRFILPLSILASIFFGLVIHKSGLLKNKIFLIVILLFLLFGLIWNFRVISENYDKYSYFKEGSRYVIMKDLIKNPDFPIKNEFSNYRLGTPRYLFGETINYFMPKVSQTLGYQDVGMLNPASYYDMRWHIWMSNNFSGALYYLNWFGIKYFEFASSEFEEKFQNSSKFRKVLQYSDGDNFTIYEYLDAKPIISLVDSLNEGNIGITKEFSLERKSPDRITINYNSTDENDVVLFKEFYHSSWVAKDSLSGKRLEVIKVGPGFMAVSPVKDSKGVVFYQKKSIIDYFAIILSLTGVALLFIIKKEHLN